MARAHGDAAALSSDRAAVVWDLALTSYVYRADHPLKPGRLIGVHDTLAALGAFEDPNSVVLGPRAATPAEIQRIHDPRYIAAVRQASDDPAQDYRAWGLDLSGDTPPFAGMHEASLLTTGGTLRGMEEVLAGRVRVAFNGSGGLHHAMRDHAKGFCIYNDPAIVCGLLADRGMRVAYVDIDAHHGDGVQAAFYDTDQVLTISLHESGRTLFPGTGFAEERGTGSGAGYSINVALPAFTDDLAYGRAFAEVVPTLIERYRPDVLVTQQGIDSHFNDPLTHLLVSTHARAAAVATFRGFGLPWIAMGGGGYDEDAVRRAWSIEYLIMLGAPVPAALHDANPPSLPREQRMAIDIGTDRALAAALAASFR